MRRGVLRVKRADRGGAGRALWADDARRAQPRRRPPAARARQWKCSRGDVIQGGPSYESSSSVVAGAMPPPSTDARDEPSKWFSVSVHDSSDSWRSRPLKPASRPMREGISRAAPACVAGVGGEGGSGQQR